jgi:hypothetical protein
MRRYRNASLYFLATTILIGLLIGCGQEVVNVPTVVSTVPARGATGVVINTTIGAPFSVAMNPATITSSTFTVTSPDGSQVVGSVSYTGLVATFTPGAMLSYGTTYTATITTGAKTPGGTPLLANYIWSFTTITPPPAVIATTPVSGATNVPAGQILSATFSEAMSAATISGATFTVTGPGGTGVTGTVTYSGVIATFTPAAPLASNTLYTATISTGATSVAGIPLPASYVWTFTTIIPPPAVISTIPLNAATGVRLNQTVSATFNQPMACPTLASPALTFTVMGPGTTAVAGTVSCALAVATFTPAADFAVNTIYRATITTAAKNVQGAPLAANYVWTFRTVPAPTPPTVISVVPANLATGVPTNQALSATFSLAMDLTTINGQTFKLAGPGATPVTGVVTYDAAGSVATFKPSANLAANTVYTATVTTGSKDLAGIALAQNFAWTFTTAATPIITRPTVIATIPLNAATNVPINQAVSATFSKAMNSTTINSTNFKLTGPDATPVAGLVTYASIGNTLTFTPTVAFAASTLFTATITTGVQDLAGNALAANYVWTFTTGTAPTMIAPELVLSVPANTATDVPLNQAVSATFTEAMDPLTITPATFQLTQGGNLVPAALTYDPINFIATLTPTIPLTASTGYIATVTDGATNLAGVPLGTTGAPNPWNFTTGTSVITPPVVLGPTVSLFGGFGGNAGMTNQGINTVVNGDVGTTAASSLMTGFHDTSVVVDGVAECTYTETPLNKGLVNGTINTAPGTSQPTAGCPNEGTADTLAIATLAASEALTAYNTLAAIPNGLDVSVCAGCGGGLAGELGNRTLAAGVYKSAVGSYSITAGDLTLDAKGNPNAFWVFQMSTSLTVGSPSASRNVLLVNGAQASNVFWQVGSAATINYGGGGTIEGTIISSATTTVSSPGVAAVTTINGRVLALNASVTIVNTVINVPLVP